MMATKRANISINPGVMFGAPCIGETRITTEHVAGIVWVHGIEEVNAMWDYLTERQILVACWYEATYRPRTKMAKQWREWRDLAAEMLWHTDGLLPSPPPPVVGQHVDDEPGREADPAEQQQQE